MTANVYVRDVVGRELVGTAVLYLFHVLL